MRPVNRTYAPLQALADELVRCGMTHAMTCPGSRNAPLIYALAETDGLEAVSVLDERSAGFMALGIAKASGRPVAVTCTSGTAAANLMPAVVEAYEARVPLIVLTADRPPELRDTGAGQAIDQLKLYGSAAKWFVEVGNHEPSRDTAVFHRALACRAWATAAGGRPGPVHLNFPLREPLAPRPEDLDPDDWAGRDDGKPWVEVWEPPASAAAGLATDLAHTRGALVCGPGTPIAAIEPVTALADATGWPILAEPTSGLRCGAHNRGHVVAHYDVLLRDDAVGRGAAAADRHPDRRHADVEAAARLARAHRAGRARPVRDLARADARRAVDRRRRPGAHVRRPGRDDLGAEEPGLARELAHRRRARSAGARRGRGPARAQDLGRACRPRCRRRRPSGSARRCRSATSRASSPRSRTRSASWRTAARTGSTASCPPPPAPRSRRAGERGCSPASSRCCTTSAGCWPPRVPAPS